MTVTPWRWVGERALLRAFDGDLLDANGAAQALRAALAAAADPEVEDLVPGARTLLVLLRPGADPSRHLLEALERPWAGAARVERPPVEISVGYGGEEGPDLDEVARLHGLSPREVVHAHTEPVYVVGFIGFSPGFPYLLGLPDAIATPRLETPRTRVPAGSVGIGGGYTGVYPRATPGGWRLIGRTSLELFDAARRPPATLASGDRVRFVEA